MAGLRELARAPAEAPVSQVADAGADRPCGGGRNGGSGCRGRGPDACVGGIAPRPPKPRDGVRPPGPRWRRLRANGLQGRADREMGRGPWGRAGPPPDRPAREARGGRPAGRGRGVVPGAPPPRGPHGRARRAWRRRPRRGGRARARRRAGDTGEPRACGQDGGGTGWRHGSRARPFRFGLLHQLSRHYHMGCRNNSHEPVCLGLPTILDNT